MSESTLYDRTREVIFDEWDILIILLFFGVMTWQAVTTLSGPPRQFPLLFLAFGLVAMTIELATRLLPPVYSEPIQRLTTGIAAEMDEEVTEELEQAKEQEDETEASDTAASEGDRVADELTKRQTLGITIALVAGFSILSYYISFMLAMPLFVFASFWAIGSRNVLHAAITTVILLVMLEFVFAGVMNVPIDTGALFGWEDVVDWVGL